MPPILATLKTLPARYWCRAAAALISLYFGAAFVHGVLWRGHVALLPWLLALLTSLALAALPWLWLRYHAQLFRSRTRPPTIHEQTLARAHSDLVALRENAVQYRSRADGERIGLLLEQLCNHSETYLENLRGDDERIRVAHRIPARTDIHQPALPATARGGAGRTQPPPTAATGARHARSRTKRPPTPACPHPARPRNTHGSAARTPASPRDRTPAKRSQKLTNPL